MSPTTTPRELACGGWPSSLGSADLVRGALRLSAPQWLGATLFWLEGRPSEGGRQVLMAGDRPSRGEPGGLVGLREMSPSESNVRTRVHEYGGGEYAVASDRLFFVDDRDGQIWQQPLRTESGRARIHGKPAPLTRGDSRYADLRCSPDRRFLVAVEERPRDANEPENRLVAFPLSPAEGGSSAPVSARVVAAGHDFYASPTFARGGHRLAFLAWDHPGMPWQGTWLETVEWGADGVRSEARCRAGGPSESLFQPRFSPDDRLFVLSDAGGFWNLACVGEQGATPVHRESIELGRPQWVFGQSTWDFVSEREVWASGTRDGCDEWLRIDLATGRTRTVASDSCQIGGVACGDGWLACLAGSGTRANALLVGPVDGDWVPVRESTDLDLDPDSLSRGEPRVIEMPGGQKTHAFVYAPLSPSARPRRGERPPLLVKSHGGPTSSTSLALDPRIQFWTSRGFAVADVNYRGSTGYGRAYRDALEGAWGVADVEDCVAVAKGLAQEGFVDGDRLAISGGSAGGYTTLCALTFHSLFKAGASHYGIGDLEALVRDTHKFESRYTDWLVGPWPEAKSLYRARSPIHHQERLDCPIIFFQGLEDRVVPPNQTESMVAVLARRGIAHAYVPFEGEQHGFRKAENIRTALDGELYFYSRIFGFDAPHPEPVRFVEAARASH